MTNHTESVGQRPLSTTLDSESGRCCGDKSVPILQDGVLQPNQTLPIMLPCLTAQSNPSNNALSNPTALCPLSSPQSVVNQVHQVLTYVVATLFQFQIVRT
ncbi:hypothetical protein RRG08_061032 [Elysia crispata]|uniref:Uncharacterized protein n=1 Tax=Elysia crispata TaxID=231223 RepID=A0AAE1AUM1_9GAST|nr:hypothetical protein RRG08_061032 [Elysia crispata]